MNPNQTNPSSAPWRFEQDGKACSLYQPTLLRNADSDLWNDRMTLTTDQFAHTRGRVLTPNPQTYSEEARLLYLQSPDWPEPIRFPFGAHQFPEGAFRYTVTPTSTEWVYSTAHGTATLQLALPRTMPAECWRFQYTNNSKQKLTLTLTVAIPTGLLGLLSHESAFDPKTGGLLHSYFPYYVQLADYPKMAAKWNLTYCYPSRQPDSWTALEADFLGFNDYHNPDALQQETLGKAHCHYHRGVCAMRFLLDCPPHQTVSLGWILGPARHTEHSLRIREAFPPADAFALALQQQEAFLNACQLPLHLDSPDQGINSYANHWGANRCIQIGRTLRFNPSPQARNAIQDSMAMAYFDAGRARSNFLRIWAFQNKDGFMPHGLPLEEGADIMPITLIPHKDTNVWGPLALHAYLRETGDFSILDESVPFADSGTASLREHLDRGLQWLLADRTTRGLSRIGQGDWNDPLNMVGPEERGESIWLTMALIVACDLWADCLDHLQLDGTAFRQQAEAARAAVRQHAWDRRWFIRAFHDDGSPIGSSACDEGAIFLNAQSWALMAGVTDKAQQKSILQSVRKYLETPLGPAMLAPTFSGMNPKVGKLTLKSPGTGENGSLYCHAILFWVCALYQVGRPDEAWRTFRNLLPGHPGNPVARANQLPLSIPNFYRGPASPDVFGISSRSPTTGSSAWFYRILLEDILGLRGSFKGLQLAPNLPDSWKNLRATRLFRGHLYDCHYEQSDEVNELTTWIDDAVIEQGQPLPPREPGQRSRVTIKIPTALQTAKS